MAHVSTQLTDLVECEIRRSIPDVLPYGDSNVFVTDQAQSAIASDQPTVFVMTEFTSVMQVMCHQDVESVLLPADVGVACLTAVSQGCRVFSNLSPTDIEMSTADWDILSYRAHGYTLLQTGRGAGYSARSAQRRLGKLKKAAGLPEDFRWTVLSPLFPCPSG